MNIDDLDKLINETDKQVEEWALFLNNVIGILAFTLGLASLGTSTASFNALISLAFLSLVWFQGKHKFSENIANLRKKLKESKEADHSHEKLKVILSGFEKRYFGAKALLTQFPIYVFGMLFLIILISGKLFAPYSPLLSSYLGISD
jgi:hypothetical protein